MILLALASMGCVDGAALGPPDATPSADTASTTPPAPGCANAIDPGPLQVDWFRTACEEDGEATWLELELMATGWALKGGVVAVEVLGLDNEHVTEVHPLLSVDFDPCGEWDYLLAQIEPSSTYNPFLSSAFSCAQFVGGTPSLGMVAWVQHPDGSLADCVAWGPPVNRADVDNVQDLPDDLDVSTCTRDDPRE